MKTIALVTGANRGLGFETSRSLAHKGFTVLMGARSAEKGEAAAAKLQEEGLDAHFVLLDVTNRQTHETVAVYIEKHFGKLDALINNAAVLIDIGQQPSQIDEEITRRTFEVNFFGPFFLTQRMIPLLKKSEHGCIVNLSTQVAQLEQIADPDSPLKDDICAAYQASKAGLNALTVLFAKELREDGIKVNSVCPGWVMTDMGHEDLPDYGDDVRPLTPQEAVDTPVWLATLPDDGPTAGFFTERQRIPW